MFFIQFFVMFLQKIKNNALFNNSYMKLNIYEEQLLSKIYHLSYLLHFIL